MKIYHRVELTKGYIPSDKLHYKNIPFEDFGFESFGIDFNELRKEWDKVKWNKDFREQFIFSLKARLLNSQYMNKIIKEGYHKYFYLNLNVNFPQLFIQR